MARPKIGTLEWARRTGGKMSEGERWAMLARAVARQLQVLPSQLLEASGIQRSRLSFDVDQFLPPDSELARHAESLCSRVSTPALYNHCLRTYVWGRVLAQLDGIRFDDELFYVASVLHDLGLTPHPSAQRHDIHCFAVAGAYAAREYMSSLGLSPERSDALAEAICLHLNVSVPLDQGPEAHLLAAGTSLDVVGARTWDIPPADRERVLARYPRKGLKDELLRLFRQELERRPKSRTGFLCTWLPFARLVRKAPFPD